MQKLFKYTLQISDQRIDHALSKTSPANLRGKHEPHNKTRTSTIEHIRDFIKKIPAYQSLTEKDSSQTVFVAFFKLKGNVPFVFAVLQ